MRLLCPDGTACFQIEYVNMGQEQLLDHSSVALTSLTNSVVDAVL